MNKVLYLVAFALIAFTSCNEEKAPEAAVENSTEQSQVSLNIPNGHYALNKEAASINWTAKKVGGSGHAGTIAIEGGKFKVENDSLSGGIISFDMNSFTVTDIDDAEKTAGFNDHLLSADFFDIATYPSTTMSISSVEAGAGVLQALTTLDLHGTAVEYKVPVSIKNVESEEGNLYEISGQFFVNRTLHGITYGSGSFFDDLGDRAINDEVLLQFNFTASAL